MLARFEQLMEQAVEGSLRRVFPVNLQPVQLAKAAARSMDAAQVVGVHGAEVPNAYTLRLAPDDFQRFAEYHATLSREVSQYLIAYANDRGLRPVGEPRVELVDDQRVRRGTVRAEARFVDVPPAQRADLEQAMRGTRELRLAQLQAAGAETPAEGQLALVDPYGSQHVLDPSLDVVRIGRATDNDLVIENKRVSRYHAQLRRVETAWLAYDLESTNGTFLDGARIASGSPARLRAGGVLRLGDHDLAVALAST